MVSISFLIKVLAVKIEIEKTQQYIDELYTGEQWSQKMKDLKDGN